MSAPVLKRCVAVVVAAASLACAARQPAPAANVPPAASASATSPRAAHSASALSNSGWATRALPRLALSVTLPDAAHWKEVPGSRWAHLEHAPSGSLLELSTSRDRRLVTPEECAQKAYLEHPQLPRPADGDALERRRMTLQKDVLVDVTVSLENVSADEIVGHITWFGASVGRCLLGHFSTRVSGPDRDEEVARRLRLAMDGIVPSVAQLVADQRVQPEPFER